jgi:hypothetical protein
MLSLLDIQSGIWQACCSRQHAPADVFLNNEAQDIREKLEATEKGAAFMKDFMVFMN